MRFIRLCAIVASLCFVGGAGSAYAAFPGSNGILAVQPVHGAGLILVHSDGTDRHRICTATRGAACDTLRVGRPEFSADGRTILFAGPVLHEVTTNGRCVACDFSVKGVSPAFMADSGGLTYLVGGRLVEPGAAQLGHSQPAPDVSGVTDATWSATGQLALVADRQLRIGAPGHLRAIGTGSAPDWSPDGASLVLVRDGWVTVIAASGRDARRLVRGAAPEFSPDGRWVAFIGPGHRLELVPARGGRARPVGTIRGKSVAWQPLPANPPGCGISPWATVLVRTPQVQITTEPSGNDSALTECLVQRGVKRLLAKSGPNDDEYKTTTYGPAAVDGKYAAVVTDTEEPKADSGSESVQVYDVETGRSAGYGGESTACVGIACQKIGSIAVGTGGVTAVATQGAPSPDDLQVLCASASLCLASDSFGQLLTSTTPARGPWGVASGVAIPAFSGSANGGGNGGTSAGSCPSVNLCVIFDDGVIYSSTDPAAGVWAASALILTPGSSASLQPSPVSCPSTTLCVAIAGNGQIAVSTDPAGGASSWSLEDIDGTAPLVGIDCPSTSECLVSDLQGNVFSASDPTGGVGAWTAVKLPTSLWQITCPTTSLCVGRIGDAQVAVSTDPTAGTWTFTNVSEVQSISCPSASLCVGVNGDSISYSTDPASGSWSNYAVAQAMGSLSNIACPTTTFCVASDGVGGLGSGGEVLVSTDPAGGANTWTPVLVDQVNCAAIPRACGTGQVIASDSKGVRVVDSTIAFGDEGPTDLAIHGDTLRWEQSGSALGLSLTP